MRMKRICLFAALCFSVLAQAQAITGDWLGTLKVGPAELRLVLHVTKDAAGAYKATLDSIDQPGANGTPVDSFSVSDSRVSMTISAIHGKYEGTLSPDSKVMSGTWTQAQPLPLEFRHLDAPFRTEHKQAAPSDIDGAWMGTLDLGAMTLRVIWHFTNTADGLTATMDSPDQGAKGI